jgi:hypothetical protein
LPLPDDYRPDVNITPRASRDRAGLNGNGRQLLALCKSCGLRIVNGRSDRDEGVCEFTFVNSQGWSVVDYVIVNEDFFNAVNNFTVHPPNVYSDHCQLTFSIDTIIGHSTSHTQGGCESKLVWNHDLAEQYTARLNSDDIRLRLTEIDNLIDSQVSVTEESVSDIVNKFTSIIHDTAKPFYNNNSRKSVRCAWYTDECELKREYFFDCLDKYRTCETDDSRKDMVKARSAFKSETRRCRRDFDVEQTNRLVKARRENAKDYWKLLKRSTQTSNPNISCKQFAEYFQCVNNPDDPFYCPDDDIVEHVELIANECQGMFEELNQTISVDEILCGIKQLRVNASGGPDGILNPFLIHGKDVLVPYLLKLFNVIFQEGVFPAEWSEGYIIPIHKKGAMDKADNYRGITLLSSLGKLFTKILNNRLTSWAESYAVYIEAQSGFRAGMGTVDNVFVLHALITHCVNRGQQFYCGFVDFTKAFDYIVRDNLWWKLINLGVTGNMLNIIRSMYKSSVKYSGNISDPIMCSTGVRQGESLSPFLFAMYINDVEKEFMLNGMEGLTVDMLKVFLLLYADDMVILAKSATDLQMGLDILFDYCERWRLKVNTKKSNIMIFHKGRLPQNLEFKFGDSIIEIVSKFTYLGLVFTCTGSFTLLQETLAGQARKAIFKLEKYVQPFVNLTPRFMCELFDKLVSPVLSYGCELWGFITGPALERVHLQFCKRLLGVKQCTQNDFIYGELGRTPLIVTRHFRIIKYWLKVIKSSDMKYMSHVYNMMLEDMLMSNNKNWAMLVKLLLQNLGFAEVWINQGVGNEQLFLVQLKQRLRDVFVQNWRNRLCEFTRADLYDSFEYKLYLDVVTVGKFRVSLARLRTSSHHLHIESGRWHKPIATPRANRKCQFCDDIEDEYHFVLICPIYKELRKAFIPHYYYNKANMFKFVELLTTDNINTIRKYCMFIHKSFLLRNEVMYAN